MSNLNVIENRAGTLGGGLYGSDSNFVVDGSRFDSNVAGKDGGGLYKEFESDFEVSFCTGIYFSSFELNKALDGTGGGIYLSLYGEDHSHGRTCLKATGNLVFNNTALYGGDDAFFDVTDGLHEVLSPDEDELSDICDDSEHEERCSHLRLESVLRYMCLQVYDRSVTGTCDVLSASLLPNITGNETAAEAEAEAAVPEFNISDFANKLSSLTDQQYNPGDSALLAVRGWDSFGNELANNEWEILVYSLDSSLTVTGAIPATDHISWVFPMFIGVASIGDDFSLVVRDANQVAEDRQG